MLYPRRLRAEGYEVRVPGCIRTANMGSGAVRLCRLGAWLLERTELTPAARGRHRLLYVLRLWI